MLGYNMDWAAFKVIEVIAQSDFTYKRVGYLAASQSFSETTDVILLITGVIRKDLLSPNMYDGGIALDCLSNICTTELARDLVPDVVSMLSSARPYTRKKAVLVMYKIFLRFPDALRPSFPRLKEKLEDQDVAVVSAAVNVICELAKKNAKNYLPLAPVLFNILTKSNNNWMLIKVIKLFAVLIPLEERLGKKLVEPLCNIINSTNSMSLMYEAIYTCIVGLSTYRNVMQLCSSKLRMFIEHPDQNLKYLGLLALAKIMEVFPKGIMEHRDLILNCLEDPDQTIRLRAVELLTGMVDRKNLSFIVDKLRHYLNTADGPYRDELLEKIIYICSQEKYKFVTDFEWYIGILVDLTHVKGCKNGSIVAAQILDVSVRVKAVRGVVVKYMVGLLQDKVLMTEDIESGSMCEALYSAAWVIGEYADLLEDHLEAIDILTQADAYGLPAHISSIFIHNAMKVFSVMTVLDTSAEDPLPKHPKLGEAIQMLKTRLPGFTSSQHIEVQERAAFLEQLVILYEQQLELGVNIGHELKLVAEEALNPVSAQAQSRVPKPENLDLDAWINEPIPEEEDPFTKKSLFDEQPASAAAGYEGYGGLSYENQMAQEKYRVVSAEDNERIKKQYEMERKAKAEYYIGDEPQNEDGPVRNFAQDFPAEAAILRNNLQPEQSPSKGGRGGKRTRVGPRIPIQAVSVLADDENPEGWTGSEQEKPVSVKDDPLASLDLTKPGGISSLPERKHRTQMTPSEAAETAPKPTLPPGVPPQRGGRTGRGGRTARGGRAARGRTGRGGPSGRGRGGRAAPKKPAPPATAPTPSPAPPAEQEGAPTPSAPPPANPEAPKKAPPAKRPITRHIDLPKDSEIEITYELISSKTQPNRLLCAFHIKNTSDHPIENATISFNSTLIFQVAPHPKRQPTDPIPLDTIAASSTIVFKLPFQFDTLVQPQILNAQIVYVEQKLSFDVVFPASSIILATPVDTPNFYNILKNKAIHFKSTQFPTKVPLPQAVAKISALFKVSIVEKNEKEHKVSLYGQTVQSQEVAILVCIVNEQLAISIKSDNAILVDSLHSELVAIFNQ
eukprot:TRINITY_DN7803_c0_g1_i1.p1 TRINITY_DN7803_c0_g1~~TRINITY_DN7803_c0_g1_i1.p1  ORF type:complete len:1168 (+),score=314.36 TRINITY_DN7803_c0_g1_i1:302-3505(+)